MSVSQTRGVIRRSELTDAPARAESLDVYKVVRKGEIAFNKMSIRAGALGVAAEDGLVTYHYEVMRPRSGHEAQYLVYLMKSEWFIGELVRRERGIGAGEQANVRTTEVPFRVLRMIDARLPPLPEQRAIADFLDRETAKIDALVDKQNEMIDLLRARRLSNIDAVLSSAPGVQGTPLRNVVDIQTGITLGKTYGADVEVREYPYLRVANVQTGYVDTEDLATIELPPSIARQAMLRDGDVLITEGGDRAALARGSLWHGPVDPCLHQNHIYALRPRLNRLLAKYLVYVLEGSAARQYFESTRRQTTNLSATNSRLVRAFRFTLPTVDDQRFLLERLDDATARIDALIAKAEEFVELAKERRAALITAAVTGQLDVSGKGDWDGACADDPDLLAVG